MEGMYATNKPKNKMVICIINFAITYMYIYVFHQFYCTHLENGKQKISCIHVNENGQSINSLRIELCMIPQNQNSLSNILSTVCSAILSEVDHWVYSMMA